MHDKQITGSCFRETHNQINLMNLSYILAIFSVKPYLNYQQQHIDSGVTRECHNRIAFTMCDVLTGSIKLSLFVNDIHEISFEAWRWRFDAEIRDNFHVMTVLDWMDHGPTCVFECERWVSRKINCLLSDGSNELKTFRLTVKPSWRFLTINGMRWPPY